MSVDRSVLVGYANEDVHVMQVLENQDASAMATKEAEEIGKLTNAGFRTVVASVWCTDENKTAGIAYAAAWKDGEVEVLLHHGDRVATSHDLYAYCKGVDGKAMTATHLTEFCRRLKLN